MTVEELELKISVDIDELKKELNNVNSRLTDISDNSDKTGDKISKAFNAAKILTFISALKTVASTIKSISDDCIEAYTTQFEAEQKLTTVMTSNLNATDKQIESIKKLTAAQQELGIVGDEIQLAGISQLSMYKLQIESIEKLIPAMNNLIVAKDGLDVSVSTATDIGKKFAETLDGQADSLKELGIYFSDAEKAILEYGDEAAKVNLIVAKVNDTVSDMNATMSDTALGQMKQIENVCGDIKEQIGEIAANLTVTLAPLLKDILSWVNNITQKLVIISEVFNEVFGTGKIDVSTKINGADNLKDTISGIKDEAVDANKALLALAGFDDLNILNISDTGTNTEDTSDNNNNNVSIGITTDNDTSSTINEILSKVETLKDNIISLNIDVNTDEAQTAIVEFKEEWLAKLAKFKTDIEADPSNASERFKSLKDEFDRDYSELYTIVDADSDTASEQLKAFKIDWDNELDIESDVDVSTKDADTDLETFRAKWTGIFNDIKVKLGIDENTEEDFKKAIESIKTILATLTKNVFNVVLSLTNEIDAQTLQDLFTALTNIVNAAIAVIEPLTKVAGILSDKIIIPAVTEFFNNLADVFEVVGGVVMAVTSALDSNADSQLKTGTVSEWLSKIITNLKSVFGGFETSAKETADTIGKNKSATDLLSESFINAGNFVYQLKTSLGLLSNAIDNICDYFSGCKEDTDSSTESFIKQIRTLGDLKESFEAVTNAKAKFDSLQSSIYENGKFGSISMPTKTTVDTNANVYNQSNFATNYNNTNTSNVTQNINNNSNNNTQDVIDAINNMSDNITKSIEENRTVIGDEQIANSANNANKKKNIRAKCIFDDVAATNY